MDFDTAVAMDPNSALALAYRGVFRLQGGPVLVTTVRCVSGWLSTTLLFAHMRYCLITQRFPLQWEHTASCNAGIL